MMNEEPLEVPVEVPVYTRAEYPRWANAVQTRVDLMVTFHGVGQLPFTACADDAVEYGAELFQRTLAGDFGPIAPYVEPVLSDAELIAQALQRRDHLLDEAAVRIAPLQDAVDLEAATAAEVAALRSWKVYRVGLNRIEQQEGYPSAIAWPPRPE